MVWQVLVYLLSRCVLLTVLAAAVLLLLDAAVVWASLHGWLPR